MFHTATTGVRQSFGIHDLHRRFMQHITKKEASGTEETTTVELTTSNPDFKSVVHDKESTEDINEIELSEVEVLSCISIEKNKP